MVLLRSREVEPPKAKPKTPVAIADLDAVGGRSGSGDQSALDKPSDGSQAAVLVDTVAPSLHDAESTRSEPRALAGHVIGVTQGVDSGLNPVPGEVSGLVAGDNATNDPPLNSVTESASRDGQSSSRSTVKGQPKRKGSPERADGNNVGSAAVPVVVHDGEGTCDIDPAFHHRKLRKLSVKRYANTENVWMGNTLEGIQTAEKHNEKALKLLEDEKEMLEDIVGFDFNKEAIELLLKQKDTLAALKDYILSCGAKETRITKRWERSM